jgi:secondary thiamine-phosphate synthase enzyme
MPVHQATLLIRPLRQGLQEITDAVAREVAASGITAGTVTIFCRHTSCSLVIMENADPSARADLEAWFDRLVPEDNRQYSHTLEGPDDMPAHIKMALTRTGEIVPLAHGRMLLGTWQGIYLWEHRRAPSARQVIVTVAG